MKPKWASIMISAAIPEIMRVQRPDSRL